MALPKILDDALDALVVPGFSRIGYLVRAGQFDPLDHNALRGKTVVITGPTSGLGRAAAHQLAAMGADLILVGRSAEKLVRTKSELVQDSETQKFQIVIADMGDLDAVRAASQQIIGLTSSLHALIHNAGALLKERSVTSQGFETTIATHVLGPHQMTTDLLPLLKSSAGRVITVSSGGMYAASLPNVSLDESPEMTPAYYDGTRQYAIAKRMQVTLNEMWAIREPEVSFAAMHPGWADTPGVKSRFLHSDFSQSHCCEVPNKVLTPFVGWHLVARKMTQASSGLTVLFDLFTVYHAHASPTLPKCVTHCGSGATSALRIKYGYNKKGPAGEFSRRSFFV